VSDPVPDRKSVAISRAQVARLNLIGLLIAHKISPQHLQVLLHVPAPVKLAVDEQHQAVMAVAQLLAAEHGIENWTAFPLAGKQRFQAIAFDLIDSLPPPSVPHASTPP
jgi:hypothetical protein